jgi:hypothetical protein
MKKIKPKSIIFQKTYNHKGLKPFINSFLAAVAKKNWFYSLKKKALLYQNNKAFFKMISDLS